MSVAFETVRKVGFQHCDPAGIVFYPRYFEMLNSVVEEWFEDGLETSFKALHMEQRRAVPLVHVEADFTAPSRLGDELHFHLEVIRVGQASVTLSIAVSAQAQPRLNATLILAHMNLETARAEPFADALGARLRAAAS